MARSRAFFSNISGKVIFVVLGLFVVLYTVFSTSIVRELEDEQFNFRENFVWAVVQIQRQQLLVERDIEAALGRSGLDDVLLGAILLEYEILVSRVFLLRDGEGFQALVAVPEVADMIGALETGIARIDHVIATIDDPRSMIDEMYQILEPLGDPLQHAIVRTTNFVSLYNATNISRVKLEIQVLSYLFFSGLVVMILLGFFMVQQRKRAFVAEIAAQKARQEQDVIEEAADYAKMHALGTLAGGIAHEINTPAQYIQNNLEYLSESFNGLVDGIARNGPGDVTHLNLDRDKIDFMVAEVPLAIDESIQGLNRIAEIVRGIRKFAHPATDIVEQISITEEIDTAITLTRNQIKHITDLDVGMQTTVTRINGRRNHLSQALINLIVNASQAIRETGLRRGRIDILVSSDADNVYIRVRDNGAGIPEALREQVFDYFFTTKERGVGTGQGLPICRKLIQDDFNGSLTLSKDYPGGTEFVIRLPRPEHRDALKTSTGTEGPSDLTALVR